MRRGAPAIVLAAALAAGCSSGQAPAPSSAGQGTSTGVATSPADGDSARSVALRYVRRAAAGRPVDGLVAPRTAAGRRSLQELEGWLSSIPAHDVQGAAVSQGSGPPGSASMLVTVRGRLGAGAGNAAVGFGGVRVRLRRGAGGWRVVAYQSRRPGSDVARDGLSAVPNARYLSSSDALVVDAAGASAADVARVRLAAAAFPRLVSRYAPRGFDRTPVIFLLRSWNQADSIARITFPHEAVGAEYRGLVFIDVPAWRQADDVGARGVIVHELAHVASAGLVRGVPLSLMEGLARYEEDEYDRRAGAPRTDAPLAAAYRAGYPTLTRWAWAIPNQWQLHDGGSIQLAYDDGAAVVRAVVSRHGVAGVRRLAAGFRREGGGWFSPADLRHIFRRTLGEPLASVVARAHAETYADG
jgi:hypothetical protein